MSLKKCSIEYKEKSKFRKILRHSEFSGILESFEISKSALQISELISPVLTLFMESWMSLLLEIRHNQGYIPVGCVPPTH